MCQNCGVKFSNLEELQSHMSKDHKIGSYVSLSLIARKS